jgi:hypothetical protein
MKVVLTALVFTCCLTGLPAQAKDPYLIKPGKSVGEIDRTTTKAQLVKLFGQQNVQDARLQRAEGETVPGTVLYGQDKKRRLEITWTKNAVVQDVQIKGKSSLWHTTEGISLGTTLADLQRLNAKPFKFSGFGWDYGGQILSWEKGKLERSLKGLWCALEMEIDPPPPKADQKALVGDRELYSTEVKNPKVKIFLNLITVTLNPEEY